jgi:Lon protease-like protein
MTLYEDDSEFIPIMSFKEEEDPSLDEAYQKPVPILPLRNSVFFPGGVLPLAVGRTKTIALIKDAVRDDQVIGVVTQKKAEEEDPGADDLHTVGTVARIVKLLKMGEDNYSLVVQGLARFKIDEITQEQPYLKARVTAIEDGTSAEDVEVEALSINLKKLAREVIELTPELSSAATELVESIAHPGHLADLIAANIDVPIEEKQQVLETVDLKSRMNLVLEVLNRKREILKLASATAIKGCTLPLLRMYWKNRRVKVEIGVGKGKTRLMANARKGITLNCSATPIATCRGDCTASTISAASIVSPMPSIVTASAAVMLDPWNQVTAEGAASPTHAPSATQTGNAFVNAVAARCRLDCVGWAVLARATTWREP